MAKKKRVSAFPFTNKSKSPRRHQAESSLVAADLCLVAGKPVDEAEAAAQQLGMTLLASSEVKIARLKDGSEIAVHPRYWQSDIEKHVVILDAVPSSGKTRSAIVFATTLIEGGAADYVLIVTPNKRLAGQFHDAYCDTEWNEWNPDMSIWAAIEEDTNRSPILREMRPGKRCVGCVTSIQALVSQPEFFKAEIEKIGGRWVVIPDEIHHLAEDMRWAEVFHGIVELEEVKYVFGMSGTLRRHDKAKIRYVTYSARIDADGVERDYAQPHISYGRRKAQEDKAIAWSSYTLVDGVVSWTGSESKYPDGVRLSDDLTVDETKLAIWSALIGKDRSFVNAMIEMTVSGWLDVLETTGRLEQMVFVCVNRDHAALVLVKVRDLLKPIKKKLSSDERFAVLFGEVDGRPVDVVRAEKAVTRNAKKDPKHETDISDDLVREFQHLEFVALVTVAKAYEGMDAPCVKHVCFISNKQSDVVKEQAAERGGRRLPSHYNTKWEDERNNVYMLCDRHSVAFVEKIRAEQQDGIAVMKIDGGPGVPPPDGVRRMIEFLGGKADDKRVEAVFAPDEILNSAPRPFSMSALPPGVKTSLRGELEAVTSEITRIFAEIARDSKRSQKTVRAHFESLLLGGQKIKDVGLPERRKVLDWLRARPVLNGARS